MGDRNETGTFGRRLKKARSAAGLTQRELGDKINVTAQAISQYEQDKRRPGFEIACSMADILGCDIRWLMGGTATLAEGATLAEEVASLPKEALAELKYYVDYLTQKYKQ